MINPGSVWTTQPDSDAKGHDRRQEREGVERVGERGRGDKNDTLGRTGMVAGRDVKKTQLGYILEVNSKWLKNWVCR